MDMRTRWNISFPLEKHVEKYCIAAERITRVMPEDKIFTLQVTRSIQRVVNSCASKNICLKRRKERKSWTYFIKSVSQSKLYDWRPECTVWRFAGGENSRQIGCESAVIFGEYDAIERCGHALIVVDLSRLSTVKGKVSIFSWRSFYYRRRGAAIDRQVVGTLTSVKAAGLSGGFFIIIYISTLDI